MTKRMWIVALTLTVCNMLGSPAVNAQTAAELFDMGQDAYKNGDIQQAIDYFKQTTQKDANYADAFYNLGALYYNQQRYSEALEAFNKVLQINPNDIAARYETGLVYEKLGRIPEAIAAFEMISPTSSRYSMAVEKISRLRGAQTKTTTSSAKTEKAASDKKTPDSTTSTKTEPPPANPAGSKVQEFVTGFSGPTGVAVDAKGVLYVANFSKNTIYKVTPKGEKKLLASGTGINGPVGMTIDRKTGDLYIANHLDNTVSRISPDGKVTVVATGLKKPYNIFLDEAQRFLYVSQQETNSIARIQL